MKKVVFLVVLGMSLFLLQSCNGNSSGLGTIIVASILGVFILFMVIGATAPKYEPLGFIATKSTYVGGYPNADVEVKDIYCSSKDEQIHFYKSGYQFNSPPVYLFSIPIPAIKEIYYDNIDQIEHKIILGEILLVGKLAKTWRKKKQYNGLSLVVIKWNDGTFDYLTAFSCEGRDALRNARTMGKILCSLAKKELSYCY